MFRKFFGILFLSLFILTAYCDSGICANISGTETFNSYFSFIMPPETQGTYSVMKKDKGIFVSEKKSKESGDGGFAFGFMLFRSPEEYADSDSHRKIGELTAKNGVLYDMVLIRPDEVRYGSGEDIAQNYNRLYELAENIDIKGINDNKYNKKKGMKGEDLYSDILKKYKKIFDENWTRVEQYEKAHINTSYYYFFKPNEKLSDKIGYVYYDINSDGIDELIIGKIARGKLKNLIYDIYTMVNRKPQLVLSGSNTNKYFICNDNFICNEKSVSRNEISMTVYGLDRNSTRLYVQNQYTCKTKKSLIKKRKNINSEKYNQFKFIPFSKANIN